LRREKYAQIETSPDASFLFRSAAKAIRVQTAVAGTHRPAIEARKQDGSGYQGVIATFRTPSR
jgi:hypothetical protein